MSFCLKSKSFYVIMIFGYAGLSVTYEKENTMYKRILLALDLEGVNNVVGEPYLGLSKDSEGWRIARAQAALEINAAAEALFAAGAEKVALWDNHGGGGNVEPSMLDERIELLSVDPCAPRMSFAKGKFDAICYFGYHTMEGTLGGVLAHTMSSVTVQYYKLNGKYIGEVDMDSYIAASQGMPSVFFAGGDLTCLQAKRSVPSIVTVVTKKELGRNKAEFRDNGELLSEIKEKIGEAINREIEVKPLAFPAVFEKSFKRVEDAEKYILSLTDKGIDAEYLCDEILGRDAHTVVSKVYNIDQFIKCI